MWWKVYLCFLHFFFLIVSFCCCCCCCFCVCGGETLGIKKNTCLTFPTAWQFSIYAVNNDLFCRHGHFPLLFICYLFFYFFNISNKQTATVSFGFGNSFQGARSSRNQLSMFCFADIYHSYGSNLSIVFFVQPELLFISRFTP